MIGLVLAAGAGSRLRPYTDTLPKTLVPVEGDLTILDSILHNFSVVGITDITLVVGHAANAIESRIPQLQERYGVSLTLIWNDRYDWNNAYSLWLARDAYSEGAILVNGDTVHPPAVELNLLAQRGSDLLITVDSLKPLTDEAMKVQLNPAGRIIRITKQMPISEADGEYIGISLIEAGIAPELTSALETTWRKDPTMYYEDGFQLLADRGGKVRPANPGPIEWVEVDDHADLVSARKLVCRS